MTHADPSSPDPRGETHRPTYGPGPIHCECGAVFVDAVTDGLGTAPERHARHVAFCWSLEPIGDP